MKRFDFASASALEVALALGSGKPALAQDPALLPYHPPHIAVVQPAPGQSLQQDKPVIVIRFAAGEATDPVDVRSFAVSVDAKDKTNLFGVSATEAWGAVASVPSELSVGNHEVAARICSARGACSSTTSTIAISKPLIASADTATAKGITKKRRVVNALLTALRTLIKE